MRISLALFLRRPLPQILAFARSLPRQMSAQIALREIDIDMAVGQVDSLASSSLANIRCKTSLVELPGEIWNNPSRQVPWKTSVFRGHGWCAIQFTHRLWERNVEGRRQYPKVFRQLLSDSHWVATNHAWRYSVSGKTKDEACCEDGGSWRGCTLRKSLRQMLPADKS